MILEPLLRLLLLLLTRGPGVPHFYRQLVHAAVKARGVWSIIPWAKHIIPLIPAGKDTKAQWKQFAEFSDAKFKERKAQGTSRPDVFRHLLAADVESGGKLTEAELKEDCRSIIIAGSDTTSFALTYVSSSMYGRINLTCLWTTVTCFTSSL